MGLKATVIATLDAMMSCLPPTRNHDTVFASNATLAFRRNGLSDRTIRRHAAILQDLGLLRRNDSPNRKRFSRHSPTGMSLRFGFDLSPLFQRFQEIAQLAATAEREHEEIAYLRVKVRAAANALLQADPDHPVALNGLRALRRKLTLDDCKVLCDTLSPQKVPAEHQTEPKQMTVSDGQNVRHHHSSKKELNDKETRVAPPNISVHEIIQACPEAAQFASTPITTMREVMVHGEILAPMIGIDRKTLEAAQQNLGPERAAIAIWAIMQFHNRIRRVGAYFRAITSGSRSDGFDAEKLIRRLGQGHLGHA